MATTDKLDTDTPGWQVNVSFTYLKDGNGGLEHRLDGLIVHGDQTIRTDRVEVENDQVIEYGVIEVAQRLAQRELRQHPGGDAGKVY